MVPQGTAKKIIQAFEKQSITVITPNALNAKGLEKIQPGLHVVDSGKKEDVKAVLKAIADLKTLTTVELNKCVKQGAKINFEEEDAKKSKKLNTERAAEENTDAENTEGEKTEKDEAKPEGENTTEQTETPSSASALSASSFVAIAVVSVAAMLML